MDAVLFTVIYNKLFYPKIVNIDEYKKIHQKTYGDRI